MSGSNTNTDGIAKFEDSRRGLLGTIQHLLHVNPAMVPLIVLVASLVVFGSLLGSKFFSPFALTLILQQVAIDRAGGADAAPVVPGAAGDQAMPDFLRYAVHIDGKAHAAIADKRQPQFLLPHCTTIEERAGIRQYASQPFYRT